MLHQRGMEMGYETLCERCARFSPPVANELRHLEVAVGAITGHHQLLGVDLTLDELTSDLLTPQLLPARRWYVAMPLQVGSEVLFMDRRLDVLTLGDERLQSLLYALVCWVLGSRVARATVYKAPIVSRQGPLEASINGEVACTSEWSWIGATQAIRVRIPANFNGWCA